MEWDEDHEILCLSVGIILLQYYLFAEHNIDISDEVDQLLTSIQMEMYINECLERHQLTREIIEIYVEGKFPS